MGGTSLSAAKGVVYTEHAHHYVLSVPHDEKCGLGATPEIFQQLMPDWSAG